MTDTNFTCERFDELLPDWMEGTLDPATRSGAETHRRGCDRCAALVRDLETIVVDAAALPALSPSRDLWIGVADRIDTPVVALGPATGATAAAGTVGARRAGRRSAWRLGAAAAALVLLTAGVTYTVTVRTLGNRQAVASREPVLPTTPIASPAETSATAAAVVAEAPSARPEQPAASTAPSVRATPVVRRRTVGTRELYDREIASLSRILEERRDALDPRTAAILESNLVIIDRAIAESREALRRDPASRFLGQQLDRALDKKLELLRTAALLPART